MGKNSIEILINKVSIQYFRCTSIAIYMYIYYIYSLVAVNS